METLFGCLLALVILFAVAAISFLGTAFLVWVICWAFAFTFSWKIAIGVWAILFILRSIFKSSVNVKKG